MHRRAFRRLVAPPTLHRDSSIPRVPWTFNAALYISVIILVLFLFEAILESTKFSPIYKSLKGNYVTSLPCLNKKDPLFIFDLSFPVYTARHEIYPPIEAREHTNLMKAIVDLLDFKKSKGLVKFNESIERRQGIGEKWFVDVSFFPDLKKKEVLKVEGDSVMVPFGEETGTFYQTPPAHFMFGYDALFEPKQRAPYGFFFFTSNPDPRRDGLTCRQEDFEHAVLIQPHPIGKNDLILVPHYWQKKPQVLDEDSLAVALHFMSELGPESRGMRLGYNSPGACAGTNHLNFEVWSFDQKLPIENTSLRSVGSQRISWKGTNKTIDVFETGNYPVHSLVFNVQNVDLKVLAQAVSECTNLLVQHSIPHSFLLNHKRLYLLPRQFQQKTSYFSANLGFPEIAGSIFTGDRDEFRMILKSPGIVYNVLKSMVSLSYADFKKVKTWCIHPA